jgi:pimeloyl-ACP methyl ester carboxylesterase
LTPAWRGGTGEPLLLLHGFMGTWRVWELVLPWLQRRHDVLALTLAGHAGGPPIGDLADAVEAAMDDARWATAHVAGNSLGGYVALQLAARGRARTVVALAPAGGWAPGDPSWRDVLPYQAELQQRVRRVAAQAAAAAGTPAGRRAATGMICERGEDLPPAVVEDLILGVARCDDAAAMIAGAAEHGWPLDPGRVDCPLRFVWGLQDRLLPYPRAAAGYRAAFPTADWVELDGVGHCPQLDVPLETAQLILGVTAP